MGHCDERVGGVKAEGASGDHAELVVESLDDSIGEALLDVGQNAKEALANRARGLTERFES